MGRTCRSSHRRRMLVHLHPPVCPKASADNQSRSRRRMCRDLYFDEVLRKRIRKRHANFVVIPHSFFQEINNFINTKLVIPFILRKICFINYSIQLRLWNRTQQMIFFYIISCIWIISFYPFNKFSCTF